MPLTFRPPFGSAALLCLAVSILWMYSTDRWHPQDWLLPARESGDLLEVAARVQVASEQGLRLGNTYGEIDRLGQPGGADWSLYPTPDRPTFFVAGQLARFTGALPAINVMAWWGHLLTAAGFWFAARLLRWSTPWAFAGAILFSFCTHNYRWGDTLSLGYTFAWPATLVLLHWAVRDAPVVGSIRQWRWIAVACGAALGLGNPYFTFIAGQLGAWVWLRQRWHNHPIRRRTILLFLVTMSVVFFASQAGYFSARLQPSEVTTLDRNLSGTEFYALRPIEMILPPANHWSTTLARSGLPYRSHSMFGSNESTIYLGMIALLGLGGLGWSTFLALSPRSRQRWRKIPEPALAVGWVLLFSAVGGLNTLLGFLHLDIFRATNRYSFVLLLIGLFWSLGWLRRRTAYWPRFKLVTTIGIVAFGLWDQLPPPTHTRLRAELRERLEQNIAVAAELANALPTAAKVYQLPAVPFPEAGHRHQLPDYEHFRLFLHAPKLKLSYGGLRGSYSESLGRWLGRLPLDQLPAALEAAGFEAVTLDRRAYLDEGADLIEAFQLADKSQISLPAPTSLVAFRLTPDSILTLPGPGDPRFHDQWDPRHPLDPQWPSASSTRLALYVRNDWYGSEHYGDEQWRWAKEPNSTVILYAPTAPASSVRLRLKLSSLGESPAKLLWRGETVWSGTSSKTPTEIFLPQLPFTPGETQELTVQFTAPFLRTRFDFRPLGFRLIDLKAEFGE